MGRKRWGVGRGKDCMGMRRREEDWEKRKMGDGKGSKGRGE